MTMPDSLAALPGATIFDLEHERYTGAAIYPAHWPGYVYTLHRHHEEIPGQHRTSASGTIIMQEHAGTHIDALCHQAIDMEMFGGVRVTPSVQTPRGFTELGAETIPPIFRRGVVLDVAAARGTAALPERGLVDGADLQAAADRQGTEFRDGDCILVRTGWGARFDEGDPYLQAPGISADGARWLRERSPFLVGADNVAFDQPDNVDAELGVLPSHSVLIVQAGIYILENLNLEALASAQLPDFMLVCIPLKFRGVTGSPVRPLALASR